MQALLNDCCVEFQLSTPVLIIASFQGEMRSEEGWAFENQVSPDTITSKGMHLLIYGRPKAMGRRTGHHPRIRTQKRLPTRHQLAAAVALPDRNPEAVLPKQYAHPRRERRLRLAELAPRPTTNHGPPRHGRSGRHDEPAIQRRVLVDRRRKVQPPGAQVPCARVGRKAPPVLVLPLLHTQEGPP